MTSPVLDPYDLFLIDIDGVLVRGAAPIAGAAVALSLLAQAGEVLLLTNNSTRSRAQHASRLAEIGFAITSQRVLCSAYLAAVHIQREQGSSAIWVVGEEGLREELRLAGHTLAESPEEADVLVVGMDRGITYETLANALSALRAGAQFVATNEDGTFPAEGHLLPGAGAMVGALRGMGFVPDTVIGKPSPVAFRAALQEAGSDGSRAVMIGDRLETDIAGACASGIDAVLVLSGVASRADIDRSGIRPTWIAEDLAALADGRVDRVDE